MKTKTYDIGSAIFGVGVMLGLVGCIIYQKIATTGLTGEVIFFGLLALIGAPVVLWLMATGRV